MPPRKAKARRVGSRDRGPASAACNWRPMRQAGRPAGSGGMSGTIGSAAEPEDCGVAPCRDAAPAMMAQADIVSFLVSRGVESLRDWRPSQTERGTTYPYVAQVRPCFGRKMNGFRRPGTSRAIEPGSPPLPTRVSGSAARPRPAPHLSILWVDHVTDAGEVASPQGARGGAFLRQCVGDHAIDGPAGVGDEVADRSCREAAPLETGKGEIGDFHRTVLRGRLEADEAHVMICGGVVRPELTPLARPGHGLELREDGAQGPGGRPSIVEPA
jgi:hypothetical protein